MVVIMTAEYGDWIEANGRSVPGIVVVGVTQIECEADEIVEWRCGTIGRTCVGLWFGEVEPWIWSNYDRQSCGDLVWGRIKRYRNPIYRAEISRLQALINDEVDA